MLSVRNTLLIGSVVVLGRYAYLRYRAPEESAPGDQISGALAWGCGATLSALGTKALIQNGMSPITATTVTAAASAMLPAFSDNSLLSDIGCGGMVGSGIAGLAAHLNPNWPLGLRPRIFISHSFRDSTLYDTLTDMLRQGRIEFFDHSVPIGKQFDIKGRAALLEQLNSQIRGTSLMMFLAGRGVHLRPIIRAEVSMAVASLKPVLVIDPTGTNILPPALRNYPFKLRVNLNAQEIKSALASMLAGRS